MWEKRPVEGFVTRGTKQIKRYPASPTPPAPDAVPLAANMRFGV